MSKFFKNSIVIIIALFSTLSHSDWGEHFVQYTCLPELNFIKIERITVWSPNDFFNGNQPKAQQAEMLKSKNIFPIRESEHSFRCSLADKIITANFRPSQYRQNWVGGFITLKIDQHVLLDKVGFYNGVPSLSKLQLSFNGSTPTMSYWAASSENELFDYTENNKPILKDTTLKLSDIAKLNTNSTE